MVYPLIQMEYMKFKAHNAMDFLVFWRLTVEFSVENHPARPAE